MKERVISTLKSFSNPAILENPNPLFELLMKDLNYTPEELHKKSAIILEHILNNYGAFDISTIDKFNHRILRTFARDMKLPTNFEVEMDTSLLLQRAVDQLIDKVGQEAELTDLLIQFAIDKADDDRSWDISFDLNEMSKILISENDLPYLKILETKTVSDFKQLKGLLTKKVESARKDINELASSVLTVLKTKGVENDFYGNYIPKHFIKVKDGFNDLGSLYGNQLENNLRLNERLFAKSKSKSTQDTILKIAPLILERYLKIKELLYQTDFHLNVLKNLTALTVIHYLNDSLNTIKQEEDLLLISEFNELISKELRSQPAPYIYERLGERFQHYFIDEFQDTSGMQWENLIPLIENSLAGLTGGEPGSLVLVGDVKQAIYRWRGGKAEQFLNLLSVENSPFPIKPGFENLDTNYRSRLDIVKFNNSLFEYISNAIFKNTEHKALYSRSGQISNSSDPGYIEIQFLEFENSDKNEVYSHQCLKTLIDLTSEGYNYGDICIIVRKNKQGAEIAKVLSENNIEVVSPDSLLLENSAKVQFLNAFLQLIDQPKNDEPKIKVLEFIAEKAEIEESHSFYKKYLSLTGGEFYKSLRDLGYTIDVEQIQRLPIYEIAELLVSTFNLNCASDAYLIAYLDEIYKYSQRQTLGIQGFLLHWDKKKDKLSVQAPESDSAVTIMTIHKAKGLQFPVVILPYADETLVSNRKNKLWFKVNPQEYAGFPFLYTSANKNLEELGQEGANAYAEYQDFSILDSINLLYVALTRPEERLYIFTENPKNPTNEISNYSNLLQHYLQSENIWEEGQNFYQLGGKTSPTKTIHSEIKDQSGIISNPRVDQNLEILSNNGLLWDSIQQEAMEKGNIAHELLARINTVNDLQFVLSDALNEGLIIDIQESSLRDTLLNIVNHPSLSPYFSGEFIILNERDILTKSGNIYRPDRVAIKNNQAVIIDYKTGQPKTWHEKQLQEYAELIESMGFSVTKKILVYIEDEVAVKEF